MKIIIFLFLETNSIVFLALHVVIYMYCVFINNTKELFEKCIDKNQKEYKLVQSLTYKWHLKGF